MLSRVSRSAWSIAAIGLGSLTVADGQGENQRRVYVAVTDGGGKPVKGLPADAFHVWEPGGARTVVSAVPAEEPPAVAIIIHGVTRNADILAVRRTINALLSTLRTANPDTRVALVTSVETPRLLGVGSDAVVLDAAIRHFVATGPGLVLLEAIEESCKVLSREATDRRAVFAIANAGMSDSETVSAQRIATVMRDARASLWAIDFTTGSAALMPSQRSNRDKEYLFSTLTTASGGTYGTSQGLTGLPNVATRLASILASQYAVTYERPSGVAPGDLKVGVTGAAGVRVLAPTWPLK